MPVFCDALSALKLKRMLVARKLDVVPVPAIVIRQKSGTEPKKKG
jgi:hypothetical protein